MLWNVLWDSAPPAAVRGALRERFVGHVPPLQLWQLVGFDSLSCGDSCSPHRSGAHERLLQVWIRSSQLWKGYVPLTFRGSILFFQVQGASLTDICSDILVTGWLDDRPSFFFLAESLNRDA